VKIITAIIRPKNLGELKDALLAAGQKGMNVTEVKGFGGQRGHKEVYRGAEYQTDFVRKTKLEIVVEDNFVAKAVDVIQRITRTEKVGDGKIFIIPVETVVRIRTGETGTDAL
jgi:nitrogen regulatory protein PII